jgi:hypothetical protein
VEEWVVTKWVVTFFITIFSYWAPMKPVPRCHDTLVVRAHTEAWAPVNSVGDCREVPGCRPFRYQRYAYSLSGKGCNYKCQSDIPPKNKPGVVWAKAETPLEEKYADAGVQRDEQWIAWAAGVVAK